jgi:tryptophan-rich sensory protein
MRWWHGALLAAGALGLQRIARTAGKNADPDFYDAVKRPEWSLSGSALAAIRGAVALTRVWGAVRLANRRPHNNALLALHATTWAAFLAETPAFFRLRSPRLALAAEVLQAIGTAATFAIAPRASLALLPMAAWLGYALPASTWIAARNGDPFLRQPALR